MAIQKKPKITELKINLKELFGERIPDSDEFRESVGQAILDSIVERTQKGKDKDGKTFPKYSKSYKKSLEFKAHGKSSKVNLTLSEDMLNSFDIIKQTKETLTLGWEDQQERAKAEGNILGSYGRAPNKKLARDFLGLTDKQVSSIKSEFKSDLEKAKEAPSQDDERRGFILEILRRLQGGGDIGS